MRAIAIHSEVRDALGSGRPVVALESAVTTCGLPREPLDREPACRPAGWSVPSPIHLEAARCMERAVREGGAIPATIAVINGSLHIGLSASELESLAADRSAGKVAARELAQAITAGFTAGTTVSATLAACRVALPRPIRVMATGGIGGVHRGWAAQPDFSSDLTELARAQVAVVCSGVKSILDIPATLEALETLGVPVLGYGTDVFPQFLSRGQASLRTPATAADINAAADLCRAGWMALGRSQGVLIAQPPPAEHAIGQEEMDQAVESALAAADAKGIVGPARTPFLLAHVANRTGGRSVEANIALLLANARLAASLAAEIAAFDAAR